MHNFKKLSKNEKKENMKKIAVMIPFIIILSNCSFLNILTKNKPPHFLDAFIPMHESEMISYEDLHLNWEAIDPEHDQLFYDVYFGKINDPLKQLSRRQQESFYPLFFTLEAEKDYRWKIVVSDGRNVVESDTLFFKTSYYFPDWWNQQNPAGNIFYFGIATHEFQRFAYPLAEEDAKKKQAEFLEHIVRKDIKRFLDEAGINDSTLLKMAEQIIQLVAKHEFTGATIDLQETKAIRKNFFRTYVRVSVPRPEYNKKLLSAIRSARSLYSELNFSQSFRQLDLEYK